MPSVTIQAPAANYINNLPIIFGQSTDPAGELHGRASGDINGRSDVHEFLLNGTSWQAGPTPYWSNAAATDLSFNSGSEAQNLTGASTPTWANGVTYKVQAQSTDEAALSSTIVSTTFTYDNAPPTLAITSPWMRRRRPTRTPRISTTTLVGGLSAIIGTAVDSGSSGVAQVQVCGCDPTTSRSGTTRRAEVSNIPDGSAGTAWFNAVDVEQLGELVQHLHLPDRLAVPGGGAGDGRGGELFRSITRQRAL